jgi:hypothetical protein
MTLDQEIAWWHSQSLRTESDAWLIAFGVSIGLRLAKRDYDAKDPLDEYGGIARAALEGK